MTKLARYAGFGAISNLLYLGIFMIATTPLGNQIANLTALTISTIFSSEINRRFTFAANNKNYHQNHQQLAGLAIFATTTAITTLTITSIEAAGFGAELSAAALLVANLSIGAVRFQLMNWLTTQRSTEIRWGSPNHGFITASLGHR